MSPRPASLLARRLGRTLLALPVAGVLLVGCGGGSASAEDVADQVLEQAQASFPDANYDEATCEEELADEGDTTRCTLHGENEELGGAFTLGTTVTVEERDGDTLKLTLQNDDEPELEE